MSPLIGKIHSTNQFATEVKKYVKSAMSIILIWATLEMFSGLYFPVFELNTRKYGPEITQYLDSFHAVNINKVLNEILYEKFSEPPLHLKNFVTTFNVYKLFKFSSLGSISQYDSNTSSKMDLSLYKITSTRLHQIFWNNNLQRL